IKLAQELDPLSPAINAAMALPFLHAGEYEKGIKGLQRVIALDPGFYRAHLFLGTAYITQGQFAKALEELRLAAELSHRSPRTLAVLGWALGVAGDRAGAQTIIAELEAMKQTRYVPAYALAIVHAPLGLNDRAFDWLETAFNERDEWLTRLKIAREIDPLRKDPRFVEIFRRLNFPE
ncbi:MAG TPA: tetratricopeptide repeat protein, partial [Blastocatellia bacterium]|nr:tetratricopeptide repeat protein [Blastocatellia bacterium]